MIYQLCPHLLNGSWSKRPHSKTATPKTATKLLATKTATTKTATLYWSKRPHREDHYQNGQTAFGQNGHKGRIITKNGHTAFGQKGRTGRTTTKTATLHFVKTATQGGRITGPDHQQNRHTCQMTATQVTTKTATLSIPCQAAVTHAGVLARMQQGPFL